MKKAHGSIACTACQRRKIKCVGNPCAYCLKKNYVCEFKEAKRRGPKSIKLPTNTELQIFEPINYIQESMGNLSQQNDFVNFYFQSIGVAIPKSYESYLQSPTCNTSERRTQLYIITASVMKAYGNIEMEKQYINKANKSSSLFDAHTVESAISLMMMVEYFGLHEPKSRNLILMAQNILQLPSVENSQLALDVRTSCDSMCHLSNPSISKESQADYVLGLVHLDLGELARTVSARDIVTVGTTCITKLIYKKGKFEDGTVPDLLRSISSSVINNEDKVVILQYIYKFEVVLKSLRNLDSGLEIYANFVVQFAKFLVEWRNNNSEMAYIVAVGAMEMFILNSNVLAVRLTHKMASLLLLPFYFRECGAVDEASRILQHIENAFDILGKGESQRRHWAEMCGILQSYNFNQLEAELLGGDENIDFSSCSSSSSSSSPDTLLVSDYLEFMP